MFVHPLTFHPVTDPMKYIACTKTGGQVHNLQMSAYYVNFFLNLVDVSSTPNYARLNLGARRQLNADSSDEESEVDGSSSDSSARAKRRRARSRNTRTDLFQVGGGAPPPASPEMPFYDRSNVVPGSDAEMPM